MQIAATLTGSIRRHPGRAAILLVALAAAVGVALYWFAPWNLVIDRRVDEAPPGASGPAPTDTVPTESGEAPAAEPGATGRVTLARGDLRSLEHTTTGSVVLLRLEDGRRFLRLEDLETSNGPDLRVVLTDQPLSDDWDVWDDGALVDLGALEGNIGSSNYEIPAAVDLDRFETAVIWCRRFSVGFAVAPLDPVG
ncbi:MAG TPA: DM13 domain-containing protein [Actinomycetota bacterium]|jgi:hypothetical protein